MTSAGNYIVEIKIEVVASCTCFEKTSQKSGPTIAVCQLCMCITSGCFPDLNM